MRSGSLLLNAKKYSKEPIYIRYYGQKQNTSTYNLVRMNMYLNGVLPENQKLRNGDTLDGDWSTEEGTTFDIIKELLTDIENTDKELIEVQSNFTEILKELTADDNTLSLINDLIGKIGG